MLVDQIQTLTRAMQVAKAEHGHFAEQIAKYNNPEIDRLSRVDFSQVLEQKQTQPGVSVQTLIDQNQHMLDKSQFSLDLMTAQALDASGRYKTLTEVLNRKLGLMSIAVSGQGR